MGTWLLLFPAPLSRRGNGASLAPIVSRYPSMASAFLSRGRTLEKDSALTSSWFSGLKKCDASIVYVDSRDGYLDLVPGFQGGLAPSFRIRCRQK